MISGIRNTTQGSERRPGNRVALAAVLSLLILLAPASFASPVGFGQRARPARPAPSARPAPARPVQQRNGNGARRPGANNIYRPVPNGGYRPPYAVVRPGANGPVGQGQEHLPQWLAHHQNMSPAQQENLLRGEPGFNRLSPDQQSRVMNRLRTLEARPADQQERTMARNEAFERLAPEARQDVRTSASSFAQMAPDRQRAVRQAFNQLRQVPLNQRQQILNSARFTNEYSPQERHVLGSLLSVEPYQPGTN
jgi:hypothetical protein